MWLKLLLSKATQSILGAEAPKPLWLYLRWILSCGAKQSTCHVIGRHCSNSRQFLQCGSSSDSLERNRGKGTEELVGGMIGCSSGRNGEFDSAAGLAVTPQKLCRRYGPRLLFVDQDVLVKKASKCNVRLTLSARRDPVE